VVAAWLLSAKGTISGFATEMASDLTAEVVSALAVLHWGKSTGESRRQAHTFLCNVSKFFSADTIFALGRDLIAANLCYESLTRSAVPDADSNFARVVETAAVQYGFQLLVDLIERSQAEALSARTDTLDMCQTLCAFAVELWSHCHGTLAAGKRAFSCGERRKVAQFLARIVVQYWESSYGSRVLDHLLGSPLESAESMEIFSTIIEEILSAVAEETGIRQSAGAATVQLTADAIGERLVQEGSRIVLVALHMLRCEFTDPGPAFRASLQLLLKLLEGFPVELLLEADVPTSLVLFLRRRFEQMFGDRLVACADYDWLAIEALGCWITRAQPMLPKQRDVLGSLLETLISFVICFDEAYTGDVGLLIDAPIRWEERLSLLQAVIELTFLAFESTLTHLQERPAIWSSFILLLGRLVSHPWASIAELALAFCCRDQVLKTVLTAQCVVVLLDAAWMRCCMDTSLPAYLFTGKDIVENSVLDANDPRWRLMSFVLSRNAEQPKLNSSLRSRTRDFLRKICQNWRDACLDWVVTRAVDRMDCHRNRRSTGPVMEQFCFREEPAHLHSFWRGLLSVRNGQYPSDAESALFIEMLLDETREVMFFTMSEVLAPLLPSLGRGSGVSKPPGVSKTSSRGASSEVGGEENARLTQVLQLGERVEFVLSMVDTLDLDQDANKIHMILHVFFGCAPLLARIEGAQIRTIQAALRVLERMQQLPCTEHARWSAMGLHRREKWFDALCRGILALLLRSEGSETVSGAQVLLPSIQQALREAPMPFPARCSLLKCVPVIMRSLDSPEKSIPVLNALLEETLGIWKTMALQHEVLRDPERFLIAFLAPSADADTNRTCLLQLLTLFEQMLSVSMKHSIWKQTVMFGELLPTTLPQMVAALNHLFSLRPDGRGDISVLAPSRIEIAQWYRLVMEWMLRAGLLPEAIADSRQHRKELLKTRRSFIHISARGLLLFQRMLALDPDPDALKFYREICLRGIPQVDIEYLALIVRHVMKTLLQCEAQAHQGSDIWETDVTEIWLPLLRATAERIGQLAYEEVSDEESSTMDEVLYGAPHANEASSANEAFDQAAVALVELAVAMLKLESCSRRVQLFNWARDFLRKCLDWHFESASRKAFAFLRKHLSFWIHPTEGYLAIDTEALLQLENSIARALTDERWYSRPEDVRKVHAAVNDELYRRGFSPACFTTSELPSKHPNASMFPGENGGERMRALGNVAVRRSFNHGASTQLNEAAMAFPSSKMASQKHRPLSVRLLQKWKKRTQLYTMDLEDESINGDDDTALEGVAVLFG